MGAGVWVEEEALHLCPQGRKSRGVKNTLFIFGFVNGRQDFGGGAGRAALRWLP